MSANLEFKNLLEYTDHERAKWRAWLAADPARLAIPFQSGARFPTVGSLFNHVFWVEERHLSRLEGAPLPEHEGAPHDNLTALFEFGDRIRGNLRRWATTVDDTRAGEPISFSLRGGPTVTVLRRKLAAHILLHEVRHFAQVAYAVRVAGHEPPGEHDYFFAPVDMPAGV